MRKIRIAAAVLALLMVSALLVGCGTAGEKVYVIYSDNSFAPFEYLDTETNEYVGVDMEILAAIAEDQGFEYEMHNEGFNAAMGAVQAGQADAMIAGMSITDERKETYDFSDGYFQDGSIMVVAAGSEIASPEDLEGKIVAAKQGTVSTDYAESIADDYGFELTYFEDSPTMYQAVMNGTAAACFEDYSVIAWAIESEAIALQMVGDLVGGSEYGFAVKKDCNPELIEKFNAGLANIKESGKYDEILNKYGY